MLKGIQSLYKGLGASGCYFLNIIKIAEDDIKREINVVDAALKAAQKGYIRLDLDEYDDPENFFVKDPARLLNMLTGSLWTVTWKPGDYRPKPDEKIVICYKRKTYTHFAMTNFDTLQNSNTVRAGFIDSYRVFKKVQ